MSAMTMRVLVLGGSSYVAQFLLQRHLDSVADAASAPVAAADALVMGCTMRSERDSFDALLPAGFRSVELSSRPSDRSSSSSSDACEREVQVYWGVDLATMAGVRECIRHFRPDVVINCIAMSSPAACEKAPERATAINEPRQLVQFLAHDVDWDVRFIHFSTDFVYDGVTPPPSGYCESDAGGSRLTVYGASKLRFDTYLLTHASALRGCVLRIANVVGPQAPALLAGPNQPPKFMEWLHRELFCRPTDATPLRLWNDEVRSFIYVRDLVDVVFALLVYRNSLSSELSLPGFELFNVGGVDALSRVELADKYSDASQRSRLCAGRCAAVAPTSRAAVDLGYYPPLDARLNTTRLHEALPQLTLTPTDVFMDAIYHELATASLSK